MAFVTLNTDKLKHNFQYLETLFANKGIEWAVVAKLLCGHREYLTTLINLGVKHICDSRITNLRIIKSIAPDIETVFIKPPAKRNAKMVVQYADVSFNTSFDTIVALSEAATKSGKTHKIIIMVELGELREGVIQHNLEEFYRKVFELPNINVIGLGTNFTCMYGVLPSYENLSKLEHYQKLIEKKFQRKIPWLSGGASVTIPLLKNNELPAGINHFRVGETLFFGTDVYNNSKLENMYQNLFTLNAEIIELHEKPNVPTGDFGYNLTGDKKTISADIVPTTSIRAIVDLGLIDIDTAHIKPHDDSIKIVGASSDMIVLDFGSNDKNYKVGDVVKFDMDYMGTLRVMHSKYVGKRIENSTSDMAYRALHLAALN